MPKRVDTVAAALSAETTVAELEGLDLSYAPPFGPVRDPVPTAATVPRGKVGGVADDRTMGVRDHVPSER